MLRSPKLSEEIVQKKKVHRLESLPSKELNPEETIINEDVPESCTEEPCEESKPNSEEQEIEKENDDMIAVLSDGKLVWEAPTPKVKYQPPAEEPRPKSFPKTANYLQNMRTNLNKAQGRMDELHEQIEQFGTRVSSGRMPSTANSETTFHMNNNKRYHVSKSGNNNSVKAYKKWAENIQAEPEEKPQSKYDTASWDFFWKHSYYRAKEETIRPELLPLTAVLEELRGIHGQGKINLKYFSKKIEFGFRWGG